MKTESTKIKDFKIGDRFIHYGAILEVTSNVRVWADKVARSAERVEITDNPELWSARSCYGRACKFIKAINECEVKYFGGLITGYNWMQGIEEVTYGKIIN